MTSDRGRAGWWFHPLIETRAGLNRRRLLQLAGAGAAAAAVSPPRLRLVVAQTPEASPVADPATISGDADAVALLQEAARTMADLDTFAFEIETVQGETTIFEGLTIESIEGAVRRPTDFTATVAVNVPFGSINVTAVSVGGNAWIQNPLSPDDWIALEGSADVLALVNPDSLILGAIELVQDARIDGEDRIDGYDAIRIAGDISFERAAANLAGDDASLPTEVSSDPLPVLIWIDEAEGRVLEIEIDGPILTTEGSDVIRVVRFFDFNEPVDIEAPPA